jgi:peptide/nickel transport system substrate-binding protein
MHRDPQKLDQLRSGRSELENHVIDEFVLGRISRREFLRRGSIIGISIPALGAIVSACGGANSSSGGSSGGAAGVAKRGANLKIASVVPTGAIDPLSIADEGGLTMMQQTGETLVFNNPHTNVVEPVLATKWASNATGDVWTFTLREGVTFSNGQPMTADDVVYSFQSQTNPKVYVNAASAFSGVLTDTGVEKVDDLTVAFHLEAPNGNFPWLISSDNYNMIIVPKGTDYSKWEKTFIGTGPFVLKSYQATVGATFAPNPTYWGVKPFPAGLQFIFYATQQPQILALQAGSVDIVNLIVPQGAEAVFNDPKYSLLVTKSSQHRELSMRCDQAPWDNKLVRQAMALSLDRPGIINALFKQYAQLGNDNPFAPIFRSTNTSVPQRAQDITKAKQLLASAGHPNGFTTDLYAEVYQEIPQYAQIIKQAAAGIGININLHVESQAKYYGDAVFGKSDWLDGSMSLVDYGHRGVPNVFLGAPLTSTGTWNAAHFKNPQYDSLVKQYVGALDLTTQRSYAGQIEQLLLDETPLILAYWFDAISVTKKAVAGVVTTGMGQIYLDKAGLTG